MWLSTTLLATLAIVFSAATSDGNLRANSTNAQGITKYEASYSADRAILDVEDRYKGGIGRFDGDALPGLLLTERELAAADEESHEVIEANIDDQEEEKEEDEDDKEEDEDEVEYEYEYEDKMLSFERRDLGRKYEKHKKHTHKKNKHWCYNKCTKHGRWHGKCDHKCHEYCKKYWRYFC